jgi:hypothetical protein
MALAALVLASGVGLYAARAMGSRDEGMHVFFAPELTTAAELVPGGVKVRGLAFLLNTKHPMRLGWALEVYGRSGTPERNAEYTWARKYDGQEFLLEKGVELTPSFEQFVPLPEGPGLYYARLLLYERSAPGPAEEPLIGEDCDGLVCRSVSIRMR